MMRTTKQIKQLANIFLIITLSNNLLIAQTNQFKRYEPKSGIVEYLQSGYINGNSLLYFDKYGMEEATYETGEMNMMGFKQKSETVTYLKGYTQYVIDKVNNTATKTENTFLKSILQNTENKDLEETGMEMIKQMGGIMTGIEDVIGRPCEVWEIESMGTKTWIWMGIPLKTVIDMMGMKIIKTATNVEINTKIPPEKINVPTDVVFKEVDINNLQQLMQPQAED